MLLSSLRARSTKVAAWISEVGIYAWCLGNASERAAKRIKNLRKFNKHCSCSLLSALLELLRQEASCVSLLLNVEVNFVERCV